jgi:hypothetical protein
MPPAASIEREKDQENLSNRTVHIKTVTLPSSNVRAPGFSVGSLVVVNSSERTLDASPDSLKLSRPLSSAASRGPDSDGWPPRNGQKWERNDMAGVRVRVQDLEKDNTIQSN